MIRSLLWLVAGVVLGLVIHITVVLALPSLATRDLWTRLADIGTTGSVTVLPAAAQGVPNPLRLDPELAYGVCRLDLTTAPGVLTGVLPNAFWSVAIYDRSGTVIYSTTNRDGIGQVLDIGVFNPSQTRLLAQQRLDIAEGLLIVESSSDDVIAVVRLALPHPAMRARFEAALTQLSCGAMG